MRQHKPRAVSPTGHGKPKQQRRAQAAIIIVRRRVHRPLEESIEWT
jgi:hypothetical protein